MRTFQILNPFQVSPAFQGFSPGMEQHRFVLRKQLRHPIEQPVPIVILFGRFVNIEQLEIRAQIRRIALDAFLQQTDGPLRVAHALILFTE